MKNRGKQLDLLVTFSLFIISAFVSFKLNLKPLTGSFLYLLIPSIYLSLRERKNYKKIFWAVLLLGGVLGFVFDFIEVFNKAWITNRLVLPWKIFGALPVDDLIGFLLMTLLIVVFYEHFIDDEKDRRISPHLIPTLIPSLLIALSVIILFPLRPDIFNIPYAYLYGGIAVIAFPVFYCIRRPKLISKFLKVAASFFVVWFIAEIVVLKTGGWYFAGEYIGTVHVFGVTFPFEELFFWMMFYAASMVAYYERVIDDER